MRLVYYLSRCPYGMLRRTRISEIVYLEEEIGQEWARLSYTKS